MAQGAFDWPESAGPLECPPKGPQRPLEASEPGSTAETMLARLCAAGLIVVRRDWLNADDALLPSEVERVLGGCQ